MGFPPHSNRSVMPLDVLHARYTDAFNEFITLPEKVRQSAMCVHRDGDRLLQLLIFTEEFLASDSSARAHYVPALLYTPPVATSDQVTRQLRITLQLQIQLFKFLEGVN